eukprot:1029434-Rhodomonas_salina.1
MAQRTAEPATPRSEQQARQTCGAASDDVRAKSSPLAGRPWTELRMWRMESTLASRCASFRSSAATALSGGSASTFRAGPD